MIAAVTTKFVLTKFSVRGILSDIPAGQKRRIPGPSTPCLDQTGSRSSSLIALSLARLKSRYLSNHAPAKARSDRSLASGRR